MSNHERIELKDSELEKVGGGAEISGARYNCRAENAGTDVTVNDFVYRMSDNHMFKCDGYVNAANQTLWTFYCYEIDSNERIIFAADSTHNIMYGFRR